MRCMNPKTWASTKLTISAAAKHLNARSGAPDNIIGLKLSFERDGHLTAAASVMR